MKLVPITYTLRRSNGYKASVTYKEDILVPSYESGEANVAFIVNTKLAKGTSRWDKSVPVEMFIYEHEGKLYSKVDGDNPAESFAKGKVDEFAKRHFKTNKAEFIDHTHPLIDFIFVNGYRCTPVAEPYYALFPPTGKGKVIALPVVKDLRASCSATILYNKRSEYPMMSNALELDEVQESEVVSFEKDDNESITVCMPSIVRLPSAKVAQTSVA